VNTIIKFTEQNTLVFMRISIRTSHKLSILYSMWCAISILLPELSLKVSWMDMSACMCSLVEWRVTLFRFWYENIRLWKHMENPVPPIWLGYRVFWLLKL